MTAYTVSSDGCWEEINCWNVLSHSFIPSLQSYKLYNSLSSFFFPRTNFLRFSTTACTSVTILQWQIEAQDGGVHVQERRHDASTTTGKAMYFRSFTSHSLFCRTHKWLPGKTVTWFCYTRCVSSQPFASPTISPHKGDTGTHTYTFVSALRFSSQPFSLFQK